MAFVYVDRINNFTIVHRDLYSKRSLIIHASNDVNGNLLLLSSCQIHIPSQNIVAFEMPSNSILFIDHNEESISLIQNEQQPSMIRFKERPLIKDIIGQPKIEMLAKLLTNAVSKRTQNIPFNVSQQHDAVLVMFSGGLDSTILASIICTVLDTDYRVDLVNVSFDAKTSADRITAILSFYELLQHHPEKKLRLICADYNIQQVLVYEKDLLALLQPKTSHMDFNIGCALYYASKGEGYLFNPAFYDTAYFADMLYKIQTPASGKKNSYDYGVVSNKIMSIDPQLYYS